MRGTRISVITLAAALFSAAYAAPAPLQLLQAATMNYITRPDSSHLHLVRDVKFKKGSIFIDCQEAFHYEDKHLLVLKQDVHIRDGEKNFYGDRIFFNTKTDRIRIPEASTLDFEGQLLRADELKADLEQDIFTAKHNVFLSDSGRTIQCDSLTYFEDADLAHIMGNAVIRDSTQNTVFLSELFDYYRENERIMSLAPARIVREDSLGTVQMTLDARHVEAFMEQEEFLALDSVFIRQDSLQAYCDSFYFAAHRDRGSLHKDPRIIHENSTLTGDDIFLNFEGSEVRQADIVGRARMEHSDSGFMSGDSVQTPVSKTSHLTGLRLLVDLEENKIRRLTMAGMASSEYHVFEDSIYQGLNSSSGDTVRMNFGNGELQEISILQGARGIYYPNHAAVTMDTSLSYNSDLIHYYLKDRQTDLVKKAELVFGEMTLKADTIKVLWNRDMLYALPEITDTGLTSLPEMQQEGDRPLVGELLTYNIKTRRGKIVQGRTQLDDGYYQGETILNRDNTAFFVRDGKYSTCDQPDPHFWIESRSMKLIPQDKVFARPLILKIQHIPVFALPFGFFPAKGGGRQSGWIMPGYGYRAASGRFLRDGGYYWAPNDYYDARVLVNFYDKWGFLTSLNSRYSLRYILNGNISAKYKRFFIDQTSTSYDINVQHSQILGKYSRLNINGSYTNDRTFYNTTGVTLDERLNQKLTSNATYTTRFGPFSFQGNLSRTEDLVTGNVSSTVPNLSLSKSSAQLFKPKNPQDAGKWYHNFTYSVNSRFSNTYSSTLQSDSTYLDKTVNGLINNGSLKYTGKLFKWLSLSPTLNYRDGWVFRYNRPVLDSGLVQLEDDGSIMLEEINDFRRRGTYDLSLSANTKLYGIFPVNIWKLQAVRHVLSPSLSWRYVPDFSTNTDYVFSGTDINGNAVSYDYFRDSYIGGTGSSESQSLNYSLGNQFAAKIAGSGDKPQKYDFLTLNLSGSYNFTADSMNYSPISVSYRASKLPGNLQFSGSLRLDPYKYDTSSNRRVDVLLPAPRMTNFSFDTGFQFKDSGKRSSSPADSSSSSDSGDGPADFGSWSANIGIRYTYSASNPDDPVRNLAITGSMSANITRAWKVSYSAKVDLVAQALTYHHLTLTRDLHCWTFKFDWTPSGPGEGYYLLINVKAPTLQDLKLEERGGRSTYYGSY